MNLKRKGKFIISGDLLRDESAHDVIRSIMSNVIILRAEFMWMDNHVEYAAVSDLFEEVAEGKVAPDYTFDVNDYSCVAVKNEC